MYHELKCWPEYFEPVIRGEKKFEIRRDDRGFKVNDDVALLEFDPEKNVFTGRKKRTRIKYIYRGSMCAEGYCVLSLRLLPDIGAHFRW